MHHSLRKITAMGCLGWAMVTLALHGCSSRLGPVQASQNRGGLDHPTLPDVTIERSQECMAEYGSQLAPGVVNLTSSVIVDDERYMQDVTLDGVPSMAPDFAACMRIALREMPFAEGPWNEGVATLNYRREHASDSQEALRQFIEVIPGVPIVESELVIKAEGRTVVLPVTVKVIDRQVKPIDLDKAIVAKIGQMALDSLGYDEIIRLAKEQGWVKTVSKTEPKAPVGKGLIGQVETEVVVLMFEVFTEHAVTAGIVSQLDSPLPGPADILAIGIIATGLYEVGVIGMNALTAAKAPAPTSSPPPPPPPPPQPPPPPRETCEEKEPKLIRCDDPKISHYDPWGETQAFSKIKVKGIRKEESKKKAERGPCVNRGGFHTRVKSGKDYIASIVGCNCCDDSSGKAIPKERTQIQWKP